MTSAPRAILIVEDNQDDYEACATALTEDARFGNPLVRARDGTEALDFLFGRTDSTTPPPKTPCLILLDLNMPGVDGREILLEVKRSEALRKVPVVVMTSSRDPRDIEACYDAGANSYVVKPVTLKGFFDSISRLRDYWFDVSLLPGNT